MQEKQLASDGEIDLRSHRSVTTGNMSDRCNTVHPGLLGANWLSTRRLERLLAFYPSISRHYGNGGRALVSFRLMTMSGNIVTRYKDTKKRTCRTWPNAPKFPAGFCTSHLFSASRVRLIDMTRDGHGATKRLGIVYLGQRCGLCVMLTQTATPIRMAGFLPAVAVGPRTDSVKTSQVPLLGIKDYAVPKLCVIDARIGDFTGKVGTNRPPASREVAVTVRPGVPCPLWRTAPGISQAADVRYFEIAPTSGGRNNPGPAYSECENREQNENSQGLFSSDK